MIDSGLDGSTDFHSSHPRGRGTMRAENAQGTPTQSHISPSILVHEHKPFAYGRLRHQLAAVESVYTHSEGAMKGVLHDTGGKVCTALSLPLSLCPSLPLSLSLSLCLSFSLSHSITL